MSKYRILQVTYIDGNGESRNKYYVQGRYLGFLWLNHYVNDFKDKHTPSLGIAKHALHRLRYSEEYNKVSKILSI